MWGRLGLRFTVEALFLIAVAVGLGLSDARALVIVVVMAAAWLLVALIEVLASRVPRYEPLASPVPDAPPPAPAPVVAPPVSAAAVGGVDTEPGLPPDAELASEPPQRVEDVPQAEPAPVEPAGAEPRRRSWFGRRKEEAVGEAAPAQEAVEPVPEPAQTGREAAEPEPEARQEAVPPTDEQPRRRSWFRRRPAEQASPDPDPDSETTSERPAVQQPEAAQPVANGTDAPEPSPAAVDGEH